MRPAGYFVDLLPWDCIPSPGVVRHVDGALTRIVRYRGPERASAHESDLAALARCFDRALRLLQDHRWVIHIDLERSPAPAYPSHEAFARGSAFALALDEERRERYHSVPRYQTTQYLVLTWHPPTGMSDEQHRLDSFEKHTSEILDLLCSVLPLVERLSTVETYQYLHRALTLSSDPIAPRQSPLEEAVNLEAILAVGDLEAGLELRLADRTIVPIAFATFPTELPLGTLDWIRTLELPARLSLRYLPHSAEKGRQLIRRQRTRWTTRISPRDLLVSIFRGGDGGSTWGDRAAPEMARDADQALRDVELEDLGTGYVTLVALTSATDPEEARSRAQEIVTAARRQGLGAWIERYNALEAYLGSLPGEGRANVRRPLLTSRAVSHLAPLTSSWSGTPEALHPALLGRPAHLQAYAAGGGSPVWLSLASQRLRDVQHALIVGPTGAGKSVLLNLLLAQWLRYPHARIRSFDKGYSQILLARALEGEHYAFSADQPGHQVAPLARLDSPEDRQRALEWLLDLFRAAGLSSPTTGATRRIAEALEQLRGTERRNLSTLALKLQDLELRQALEPYTSAGPYGHLFDGHRSGDQTGRRSRVQIFEMGPLLNLPGSVVTPLLVHVLRDLEAALDGTPTLVALEEVAGYLHQTHFARKIGSWLLELRKANAGVVLVIQALDTLINSPLRSPVLEGCPTRVYLPNPAAVEEPTRSNYEAMGLTSRQIEIIAHAMPRREYYVVSPDGASLVTLDLSPGALRVLGQAGPEAQDLARQWEESSSRQNWLRRYLEGTDVALQIKECSRRVAPPLPAGGATG